MKLGMGHPMGPLQLADFIGLDVCLAILNVMYDGFKTQNTLLPTISKHGPRKLGVSGEGFRLLREQKAERISKQFV
jgi:3-hydroxybutyryl-CoA dehydrogenase